MRLPYVRFAAMAMLAAFAPGAFAGEEAATVRVQRMQVPGGELVTYFQRVPSYGNPYEVPLMAVLRDTLGDPDPLNDKLRNVWVFTYRNPSVWRRAVGAIPFLYTRAPIPDGNPNKPPAPVFDMSAPARGVWTRMAGSALQTQFLEPMNAASRLVTRSYAGNYGEYRRSHLWQALDVLESAPDGGGLDTDELRRIQGRLELSGKLLGQFVGDEYLERAWEKSRTRRMQSRAANWDILRQRAEENGLYFQPLSLAGLPESWALLWVAESDLGCERSFDGKFLGISDPFRDSALRNWRGYSEEWWLDESGSRVQPGSVGARPARMIPLALYSLDHTRAPLLLADMRRSGGLKRAEMAKRLVTDVATGVIGWTGVGAWPFTAAKSVYAVVRGRHGVAVDRSARMRAYVQVAHALHADRSLNPVLRSELTRRVDSLRVNPIEHDDSRETQAAMRQYEAFAAWARGGGLQAMLERERAADAQALAHGAGERMLLRMATGFTLGVYRHRDNPDSPGVAEKLAERRREVNRRLAGLPPLPPVAASVRTVGEESAQ